MDQESNEVILSDCDGRLYEGLSSNFFVINAEGNLQTAPLDRVLIGTVMKGILEEFRGDNHHHHHLVLEHANVSEIRNWKGAFITSTSRRVLPVNRILLEDGEIVEIPESKVIENIRDKMAGIYK
jgi:branched-subunit amino acid aminotransferase/4-amino-4-deoxychorismate lyase